MDRAAALAQLERHQPYRLLFLLRVVRCSQCRIRWPCPAYVDARSSLLTPTRLDIAETLHAETSHVETSHADNSHAETSHAETSDGEPCRRRPR